MKRLSTVITFLLFSYQAIAATDPDIVLIVADYMGYADTEPYGAEDISTPAIATLAEQGIRYTHHYAAAPSCIPSRAALLSGRYPRTVLERNPEDGVLGLHERNNHLLQGLKQAGYRTAAVGKWHLGSSKGFHPLDHGFDYFYGFDSWTLAPHNHLTSDGEPGLRRNRQTISATGYLSDLLSQQAMDFMTAEGNEPRFLYLNFTGGLPPYQSPSLPEAQWHTGWQAQSADRSSYAAKIEQMDRGIGTLLASLKENTLVIFTYDHGGRHLVDSGPLFHGFSTLWEGGIRVPLIMRWPGQTVAGSHSDDITIAMDITATILAAAGQTQPGIQGLNLFTKPGPKEKTGRNLFWQHGRMSAVRRGPWKYLRDGHTQFLFNVEKDSGERHNLFYQHPVEVQALSSVLERWQEDQP